MNKIVIPVVLLVVLASVVAVFVWVWNAPYPKGMLSNRRAEEVVQELQLLAQKGPQSAYAVPTMIEAMQTNNEDVRLAAIFALREVGKPAVPQLMKAMDEPGESRYYAVWALALIGPEGKEAGPKIIEAAGDRNDDVRRKAVYALGRMAPDVEGAVDALSKALRDQNLEVRQTAAEALGKYGPEAMPALKKAINDKTYEVRLNCVKVVGEMGPDAKDAVPDLVNLLQEKDDSLRWAVNEALAKLGVTALPALTEALGSEDGTQRTRAVEVLGRMGTDGAPVLVDALKSKHVDVRRLAAQTLGGMGIGDKLVVLSLAAALKDMDSQVRLAAVQSLSYLPGPAVRPALPYLEEAVKGEDPALKAKAQQVINIIRRS